MEEKDIEFIERYLEGKLSAEEEEVLEEKAVGDTEFNKLLGQMKVLVPGIRYSGRNRMLAELKKLEANLDPIQLEATETKVVALKPQGKARYWVGIAASILLLATFTFIFINDAPADLQEVYTSHFEAYPNIIAPTKRGEEIENESAAAAASRAYEQGNYEQAIILFETLPETEVNEGVLLLKGNTQLILGQLKDAIVTFEKVIQRNEGFISQAKWYKALAHMKAGNREIVMQSLQELAEGEDSYAAKARKVLDEMD